MHEHDGSPADPARQVFSLGRGRFLAVQLWTASRVPIAIVFAVLALTAGDGFAVRLIGLALLGLIELTDVTDGLLARSMGVESPFGAMLDPFADSVSRLIVYWTFGQLGLLYAAVVLVMAVRDVTVAYCRIVLAGASRSVSARRGGKIKAIVQAIVAFAAWIGPWYWPLTGVWTVDLLSWTVIAATAYSVVDYLRDALPLVLDRG
jgi:phosphatidylglycerophosphate synthase